MKIVNLEQQAVVALRACLQEISFVQVTAIEKELEKDGINPDFWATLKLPTYDVPLLVEVKSSG